MSNHSEDEDVNVYKTLLESTKAIPWRIDWATTEYTYVGPQIEELLGWKQDTWKTVQDWADRIHELDRQQTVDACMAQSKEGIDHEADYRALKADGNYVWVREVVHVIRENGETKELVGFLFDISERKAMEQELVALNRKLEFLSNQDGLTGISNRRFLNTMLERSWTMAERSQQPISVLMIDIDHFKKFNDYYGHIKGDECIVKVAKALESITKNVTDICGRYGGEEFLLILPNTELTDAIKLAEDAKNAINELKIIHSGSPHNLVSVSIGVASLVPEDNLSSTLLLERADHALYQSKKNGRNRVNAN